MRHVVKPHEVARLWINQSQDDARNRRGNFYFNGLTIYSYGRHFPIAKLDPEHKVVFITTKDYSRTTGGHIGEVSSAIHSPYNTIIYSKYIDYIAGNNVFLNSVLEDLLLDLFNMKAKCFRSLNQFGYIGTQCDRIKNMIIKFVSIYPFPVNEKNRIDKDYKLIFESGKTFTYGETCVLDTKQKRLEEKNKIFQIDNYIEENFKGVKNE